MIFKNWNSYSKTANKLDEDERSYYNRIIQNNVSEPEIIIIEPSIQVHFRPLNIKQPQTAETNNDKTTDRREPGAGC
jgi:hypothetical protein